MGISLGEFLMGLEGFVMGPMITFYGPHEKPMSPTSCISWCAMKNHEVLVFGKNQTQMKLSENSQRIMFHLIYHIEHGEREIAFSVMHHEPPS